MGHFLEQLLYSAFFEEHLKTAVVSVAELVVDDELLECLAKNADADADAAAAAAAGQQHWRSKKYLQFEEAIPQNADKLLEYLVDELLECLVDERALAFSPSAALSELHSLSPEHPSELADLASQFARLVAPFVDVDFQLYTVQLLFPSGSN